MVGVKEARMDLRDIQEMKLSGEWFRLWEARENERSRLTWVSSLCQLVVGLAIH